MTSEGVQAHADGQQTVLQAGLSLFGYALYFLIARHAQDSNIAAEFVQLAARLFQQAMDAGYAREEVLALFKVLQKPA